MCAGTTHLPEFRSMCFCFCFFKSPWSADRYSYLLVGPVSRFFRRRRREYSDASRGNLGGSSASCVRKGFSVIVFFKKKIPLAKISKTFLKSCVRAKWVTVCGPASAGAAAYRVRPYFNFERTKFSNMHIHQLQARARWSGSRGSQSSTAPRRLPV
eukprot:SAG31_NODE_866_length_11370_cov_4.806761_11_plen_156_part_00